MPTQAWTCHTWSQAFLPPLPFRAGPQGGSHRAAAPQPAVFFRWDIPAAENLAHSAPHLNPLLTGERKKIYERRSIPACHGRLVHPCLPMNHEPSSPEHVHASVGMAHANRGLLTSLSAREGLREGLCVQSPSIRNSRKHWRQAASVTRRTSSFPRRRRRR